jgi:signal transduction histidine kinase
LAIASTLDSRERSRAWEIIWAGFALVNLVAMFVLPDVQTVPFHFIWVSLTLLYGWAFIWSFRHTMVWFTVVTVATGIALTYGVLSTNHIHAGQFDELTEIPLMAVMFLACVWHVNRRQAAADEAASLAASRQRLLDREREFLRDASHGLRTPIQIARGHADLLLRDATDPTAVADLDIILDELDRLARISDHLLMLAASEVPGFLRTELMSVGRFVEGAFRRWEATAPRRWTTRIEWDGEVWVDQERLRMAIDALIENAVKYTDADDAIDLTLRRRDGWAEIEVADGGSGVDPTDVARIFDRFARDATAPAGRGGTGLGLSIAKAIVEAHGGTIALIPRAEAGACFVIDLPIGSDAAPDDHRMLVEATRR